MWTSLSETGQIWDRYGRVGHLNLKPARNKKLCVLETNVLEVGSRNQCFASTITPTQLEHQTYTNKCQQSQSPTLC